MSEFDVIPVLDLKDGRVVHAKGGKRADYRPIDTRLGDAGDPLGIASALLAVTSSPILYIADLDAIEGTGNHFDICRDLGNALPATALWIDAGFTDVTDCAFWLPLGATLVIGSESLPALDNWVELRASFDESLVLSLDNGADGMRGPQELWREPALWPNRVIAISLTRVGTGDGPDIGQLQDLKQKSETCALYAGGGVRGIADLDALADAGASGALIATALHDGAITQNEIAAFQGRRRSRSD
jgi:phosphoribosylformimino-5-aminoimidazole carboxamide ribotide isomerase